MSKSPILLFIRLSRPLFVFGAALVYALGVGIAKYLGYVIDWDVYLLGQVWVSSVQLTAHYLNEYFDYHADLENSQRTPFSGGSGALGVEGLPRNIALFAAIFMLTLAAVVTSILLRNGVVGLGGGVLMLLIFLGAFFYSVPPIHLAGSGFGELTTSIIVANLVPALGFYLQVGELHRLLSMSTFPITLLHLSMMLVFELPDYASDIKHQKQTLLVRLGWQKGMTLHNLLVLMAFLVLALAILMGLPLRISWQAFLAFPLGLFNIWYMNRIRDGAKPQWKMFTFSAVALFGLFVYLTTFAYWTN